MAVPILLYTDLDSGPNTGGENNAGIYIRLFGRNFGSVRGASFVTIGGGIVSSYITWSNTQICVQLGSNAVTGNIVVTTVGGSSNALPFTVRSGRIFFVSPSGAGTRSGVTQANAMNPNDAYASIQPGDTYYYLNGTYSGTWGASWAIANYNIGHNKTGTIGNPVAFSGYPGHTATFNATGMTGCWNLMDGNINSPDYYTIANFTLIGGSWCLSSGAITPAYNEVYQSGAKYLRVVNNIMWATYGGANTMTGILAIGGVGNRVYGNEFKDTGTPPPINNNHTIYIQVGSSDTDVAWNYIHNMKMGHLIQVHTDTPFLYQDVRIHDNLIIGTNYDDCRGINVGNVLTASYGSIYNNIISTVGQNFSAIALYGGTWKVYNNTLHNIHTEQAHYSGAMYLNNNAGHGTNADVKNNIIWVESTASLYVYTEGSPTYTLSNNLYYNGGSAPVADVNAITGNPLFVNASSFDFHLQSGSPARNTGTSTVNSVVTKDYDGILRGSSYDIGAYEYDTVSLLTAPTKLRWRPN